MAETAWVPSCSVAWRNQKVHHPIFPQGEEVEEDHLVPHQVVEVVGEPLQEGVAVGEVQVHQGEGEVVEEERHPASASS